MRRLLIVLGIILLDQLSKIFVLNFFPQMVVYNKGIAFGFLPSNWWLIINLFILAAIAYKIKRKLPVVLIVSGGISNILDRIIRGAVVDFIDLKIFPIFNFADVFICLGAGIMILLFCDRTQDYFSGQ